MKALYIPAALLAAILALSLWSGQYVKKQSDDWARQLETAAVSARSDDWNEAGRIIRRVYTDWNEQEGLFYTIMDHADLDEAQALFAGSFAACRERDSEDFHILLAQLTLQLQLLAESQAVSAKNIM